ncbi:hypothetical protein PHSY_004527 [Pseudozyma hubeiensis SY62]|uniref:Uncharacterized protein n=1 Tax=Pseudozyma hubeiensis (strain SY62) TaxID=1305764 RepID=R9P6A9_PSEHS|nr:hypothetical protein PHSY_004527 [Pseudozyma hubeiensis SY62]GAC96943.1 hypothetical protein PHSY_004527 [Pseudozyma hubeiensis SY62]
MLSKLFLTLCLISCLFPPFAFAQQWLANGPAEYASRCAPGTKASGEYVCFTYNFDITMTAIGGVYQGYANADGTDPAGNGESFTPANRLLELRLRMLLVRRNCHHHASGIRHSRRTDLRKRQCDSVILCKQDRVVTLIKNDKVWRKIILEHQYRYHL